MADLGFVRSVKRTLRLLCQRKIYLFSMVVVPLFFGVFLLTMMEKGLPEPVPVAVVDLDHSELSRKITRTLNSMQTIRVEETYNDFNEAQDAVQRGKIFGFFVIGSNFQDKALSARQPEITYYSNFTFYVPASLVLKGFKTTSVLTQGGLVKEVLTSTGVPEHQIASALQPVKSQMHGLGNPWMNYAIYLGNSFIPCMIALMILLITVYSITIEIKYGTSRQWLHEANGSMLIAILAKLLPQTVIFTIVGITLQSIMYGFCHFPLNCSPWHMILAMFLFVVATQSLALFIVCALPNLRMGISVCSLLGVLSFSLGGFSFPVSGMYPSLAIFSYLLPVRYYFLIYVDQALNGIPLYFSRYYYAALLVFPLVSCAMLRRLRKACENPVYIP